MSSTNLQSLFRSFLTRQSTQCLRSQQLTISTRCTNSRGLRTTQTRALVTNSPAPAPLASSLRRARFSTTSRASQSTSSSSSLSLNPEIPPASASTSTSPYARALPPHAQCVLVRTPTAEDIEEAELDAEALSPDEAKLQLTDRAAEQLRRIAQRENDPGVALRISVESGGCHGYQYKLGLSSSAERAPEDYIFAHPHIQPSNIALDAVSMPLVTGSTVDFATELIGSSFRVLENPQAKGSGCGCGVSWELKV